MSKADELEKELASLVRQGHLLVYAMAMDLGLVSEANKESLKRQKVELPSFEAEYDKWYSVALRVVTQLLPDRRADFMAQYKQEKRKEISFLTYGVADYIIGLRTTRGGQVVADRSAALPKMKQQVSILESVQAVLKSRLVDLTEVLQADLFDSELEAASQLAQRGFLRGGGAMAGVVLEAHLRNVCERHSLKSRKKRPTLADLNQMLKDSEVIDTPRWRFIQHLADLRNLCDHHREREPTKDDVAELIEGVAKVSKTVF